MQGGKPCSSDADCDDLNPCTVDRCVRSLLRQECQHLPINDCDKKLACEAKTVLGVHPYRWVTAVKTGGGWLCKILGACTTTAEGECKLQAAYVVLPCLAVVTAIILIGLAATSTTRP